MTKRELKQIIKEVIDEEDEELGGEPYDYSPTKYAKDKARTDAYNDKLNKRLKPKPEKTKRRARLSVNGKPFYG